MADQPTPAQPDSDPSPAAPGGVDAKEAGITAGGSVTLHAGGDITGRDSYGDIGTKIDKIDARGGHVEVYIGEGAAARAQRRRPPPTVPAPPAQFINRAKLLAQAKQALLQPAAGAGRAVRMVGLVGMGGSGKSILANVLAYDTEVVQAFPDGIVRLELGEHPDLLAQQARLAGLLGDPRPILGVERGTDRLNELDQGADRLNELLDGARLMLILDNVWDDGYLRAFRLLQPGCALLVTTRDQDTVDRAAVPIPVGFLPPDQAMELLAAWAGQDPASLPEEASQVADECGGLPLALSIAGGMVAGGRSWHNVHERLNRADLDKLQISFGGYYPYPNILRALDASITGLAAQDRACYLDLAVFNHQGPIPPDVARWWWTQAGMDELDAEDLFARLVRCSLVQHDPASDTFTLHDLLFDYASGELGPDRVRDLHAQMATAFLDRWGGLEERLPKLRAIRSWGAVDRYGLGRCVQHLVAGDHAGTVHHLLAADWPTTPALAGAQRADNAWYLAHEHAGQPAAYLDDIRHALGLAEQATDDALRHDEPATSIGLELRYALITASIVSIAARILPAVLVALIDKQRWTPARALSYARQLPSPDAKAQVLSGLAPHLLAEELATALDLAHTITKPGSLAQALTSLAPYLPPDQLAAAVELAHTITDPGSLAQAVAGLAPYLPPDLLAAALELAHTITDPDSQDRALTGLAPYLAEPERRHALADALTAIRTSTDLDYQVRALTGLAPHLPPDLLATALEVAHTIADPGSQVRALTGLAPHLAEPERRHVLADALDTIRTITNIFSQALALAGLASQLPPDLLAAAVGMAHTMTDPYSQVRALTGLGPYLPEPDRAVRHALAAIPTSASAFGLSQAEALIGLAPQLPPDLLATALGVARAITGPKYQALALAGLAPYLAEPDRRHALADALTAIRTYNDLAYRARTLVGFTRSLPHLPPELLAAALEAARAIPAPSEQARVLADLAPQLPSELLATALEVARAITDPDSQVRTLARLALHLREPDRRHVLADALTVIPTIPYSMNQAQALIGLAPQLPSELLATALEVARAITEPYSQAQALIGLAPQLPPELLATALEVVRAITDPNYQALAGLAPYLAEPGRRHALADALTAIPTTDPSYQAKALTGLAPQLPPELLATALEVARAITNPKYQAQALAGLAPQLPSELLAAALEVARAITDPKYQAQALAGLAPQLPPELLAAALEVAQAITNPEYQAQALAGLAPQLPPELLAAALEVAQAITDPDSQVRALTGIALHLPEPERHHAFADALTAIPAITDPEYQAQALAGVALHLPEPERHHTLADALTAIPAITDPEYQAQALAGLAPQLPPELLAAALEVARAITNPKYQAQALAGLAPQLPPELLAAALEAARAITKPDYQAMALAGLAPYLAEPDRRHALADALTAIRGYPDLTHQVHTLAEFARLVPHLPPELLAAALDLVRAIQAPAEQARLLSVLAPQLSSELLAAALEVASAITESHNQAQALANLGPYLPPDQLATALELARTLLSSRTYALVALVACLPESERPEVLVEALVTHQVQPQDLQAESLASLVPSSPPALLPRVLTAAHAIDWPQDRTLVMTALVKASTSACLTWELHWRSELAAAARKGRAHVMADLAAIHPVVADIGGADAVRITCRAVVDVARWWP